MSNKDEMPKEIWVSPESLHEEGHMTAWNKTLYGNQIKYTRADKALQERQAMDVDILREEIEEIISDTHDVDARDEHYARNIVDHLHAQGYLNTSDTVEPDITKCPECNGEADNGFDREVPPNPYLCTKCASLPYPSDTIAVKRGEWPDNIVADRHEVTGYWVIHYATDEQAEAMKAALLAEEEA